MINNETVALVVVVLAGMFLASFPGSWVADRINQHKYIAIAVGFCEAVALIVWGASLSIHYIASLVIGFIVGCLVGVFQSRLFSLLLLLSFLLLQCFCLIVWLIVRLMDDQ